MTKEKRCYLKRKANGWKPLGWMLPPELYKPLTDYKNFLMKERKNNRNEITLLLPRPDTDKV